MRNTAEQICVEATVKEVLRSFTEVKYFPSEWYAVENKSNIHTVMEIICLPV